MNYETRINLIGTFLKIHLLPRYKRPDHLDEDQARAELRDMTEDLNREWPECGSEDAFLAVGARMLEDLRKAYDGRTWPTISKLLKALSAARDRRDAVTGDTEEPSVVFDGALAWWSRFHDACPWAKEHHSLRMVEEGHATKRELWKAGWMVPQDWIDEVLERGRYRTEISVKRMPVPSWEG